MSHFTQLQKFEPLLCAGRFPSPWVQWLAKPESILLRPRGCVCERVVVRGGADVT